MTAYVSVVRELGVDISIPILRPSVFVNEKEHVGLVVHRMFLDVCYADRVLLEQFPLSHGEVRDTQLKHVLGKFVSEYFCDFQVNITAVLPSEAESKLYKASLSFLKHLEETSIKENIPICPMTANAFTISR